MNGAESLAILQRFVDHYAEDIGTLQAALADAATPAPARRLIVGALAYSIDKFDFFPDSTKGLGTVDDAIILRLAAKAAHAAGATHDGLTRLAGDAMHLTTMFGDLAPALDRLVGALPDRAVNGKKADEVLASKDAMVMLEANLGRELKKYKPQPIEVTGGPERALVEVRKMFEHAIKKTGV